MNFNALFFPAPADRYSCVTHFGEMFYLPKVYSKENGANVAKIQLDAPHKSSIYIPCLMIQQKSIKAKPKAPPSCVETIPV